MRLRNLCSALALRQQLKLGGCSPAGRGFTLMRPGPGQTDTDQGEDGTEQGQDADCDNRSMCWGGLRHSAGFG